MNLKIKISNGELELTASGVVFLNGDIPTVFTIQDDGQPMEIIINFKNDEELKETQRTTIPVKNKNAFEILFTNYNSVLGSYTKEPWLIGDSFGRELFLLYQISGFGGSNMKKFEYSFYLGREVNNG